MNFANMSYRRSPPCTIQKIPEIQSNGVICLYSLSLAWGPDAPNPMPPDDLLSNIAGGWILDTGLLSAGA